MTIVSFSKPVGLCLEVAAELEKIGISAEVGWLSRTLINLAYFASHYVWPVGFAGKAPRARL